jgi:hypothetical protein
VYVLESGRRNLPPYMHSQRLFLALPRRDEPLACVLPGLRVMAHVTGMDGQRVAEFTITTQQADVMPQVGYHFPVNSSNISPAEPYNHQLPFLIGNQVEVTPQRPIAPALAGYWARQYDELNLPVYELWRQLPAFVLGVVPENAADEWIMTDDGTWRLLPEAYLLCELDGTGARVVPPTFMVREFRGLAELGSETLTTAFELPDFG